MDAVYFEVSNTYRGELRKNKSGEYLSTKAKGQGIGLHSVSGLVKARGGMMEVSADNGIFRVSILLPESENSAEN
jgi:nitrogen-specific signal transduction histidine kinase